MCSRHEWGAGSWAGSGNEQYRVRSESQAAIRGRLRDLQYDSDHHEERQLMADAQHVLALLRRLSLDNAALWHRQNSDELR